MKKDCGFWDINKNYIPDIQKLNEIERKEIMETKNFNEFFDELNDMANFKNFGETMNDKEFIDNPVIAYKELKQENAELKAENARLKENDCEQCKHLDLYIKYKQTLQEIKAIVCGNYEIIDQQGRKDILKLITKAEVN